MKRALIFLVLAMLLEACGRKAGVKQLSGDDQIRAALPGTWEVNVQYVNSTNRGTTTFTPEGGLFTRLTLMRTNDTRNVTYEGYWQIQDGLLLTTITNTDNSEVRAVIGHTNQLKIVSVDAHQLVFDTKTGLMRLRRE